MEQLDYADISDERIDYLTRQLHRLDVLRPLTQEQNNEYVHRDWELTRATMVRSGMAKTAFFGSRTSKAA